MTRPMEVHGKVTPWKIRADPSHTYSPRLNDSPDSYRVGQACYNH